MIQSWPKMKEEEERQSLLEMRWSIMHSDEIEVEGMFNTEWEKNYEVERILDKRVRRFGRIDVNQYLVKWLGYGPEYNEWKFIEKMAGSLKLIEEYEKQHPKHPTPKTRPAKHSKGQ